MNNFVLIRLVNNNNVLNVISSVKGHTFVIVRDTHVLINRLLNNIDGVIRHEIFLMILNFMCDIL
jgi:hypothetical protein